MARMEGRRGLLWREGDRCLAGGQAVGMALNAMLRGVDCLTAEASRWRL